MKYIFGDAARSHLLFVSTNKSNDSCLQVYQYQIEDQFENELHIPDTTRTIERGAFSRVKNAKKVYIPDGIMDIPKWAFSGFSKLEYIRFPADHWDIPQGCFFRCFRLREIELPCLLMIINSFAFCGCKNLKMNCPNTIMEISHFAFAGCKSLDRIDLKDMRFIGVFAFLNCSAKLINSPKKQHFLFHSR